MDLRAAQYMSSLYSLYYPWLSHWPPSARLTLLSPGYVDAKTLLTSSPPSSDKKAPTRHFISDILSPSKDENDNDASISDDMGNDKHSRNSADKRDTKPTSLSRSVAASNNSCHRNDAASNRRCDVNGSGITSSLKRSYTHAINDVLTSSAQRHERSSDDGSASSGVGGCGSGESKKKKARTTFTGKQIYELERKFESKKYLTATERSDLATLLQVTETQVRQSGCRHVAEPSPYYRKSNQISKGSSSYIIFQSKLPPPLRKGCF